MFHFGLTGGFHDHFVYAVKYGALCLMSLLLLQVVLLLFRRVNDLTFFNVANPTPSDVRRVTRLVD